jgi:hypothetical protein
MELTEFDCYVFQNYHAVIGSSNQEVTTRIRRMERVYSMFSLV